MDDSKEELNISGGVRWTALARFGVQGIQFLVTVALVRILAPTEFGLLAMALVVVGFLNVFRTFGFGSAIVRAKETREALLSSVFFLNVGVGALLALAIVSATPLFSWVFCNPRVGPVVGVLSITIVISSFGMVPTALLQRRMAFHRLASAELAGAAVNGGTAIGTALAGWGVWSLVCGLTAGASVQCLLKCLLCRWRPQLTFSLHEIREVFSYGANLTAFGIFNYFSRKADNFIIGSFLGAAPLGYYSVAYSILLRPKTAVTSILMRVMFPVLSRLQDEDQRLKSVYLRACGAIALVTVPMMVGITLVARPFVIAVLGIHWQPIVPLIYIFAPVGLLQSLGATVGPLYLAKGRADLLFRWGALSGTLYVFSFLAGLPWGVVGVALSYAIMNLALLIPSFWIPFTLVKNLRIRDLALELRPYALCAGCMAIVVVPCQLTFDAMKMNSGIVLSLCVSIGIALYLALVLWLRLPAVDDIMRLIPMKWAREWSEPSANGPSSENSVEATG